MHTEFDTNYNDNTYCGTGGCAAHLGKGGSQYGRGFNTIDTTKPFTVEVTFIDGFMAADLVQNQHTAALYRVRYQDWEAQKVIEGFKSGMVITGSLWGTTKGKDMAWLDGCSQEVGCEGSMLESAKYTISNMKISSA